MSQIGLAHSFAYGGYSVLGRQCEFVLLSWQELEQCVRAPRANSEEESGLFRKPD